MKATFPSYIFFLVVLFSCDFDHRPIEVKQEIHAIEDKNAPTQDLDFTKGENSNDELYEKLKRHQKHKIEYEFYDTGKVAPQDNGAQEDDPYKKKAYKFPDYHTTTTGGVGVGNGAGNGNGSEPVNNGQSINIYFPGWKGGGEFKFPVQKFEKNKKVIYLVPLLDYTSDAYVQSVKIWSAQEAAKIQASGKLSIQYEANDICNENSEDKVLFPNRAKTNYHTNQSIFLRDYDKNLAVNSKIFVKDIKNCKELKRKIVEMNALNKRAKRIDHTPLFAELNKMNKSINTTSLDLTQNEYKVEYDKMRFSVEYVCSRRSHTYGAFFCPVMSGKGIEDLKSDEFFEFKTEVFWTERTEYMIYSSMAQLGEASKAEDMKRKEEWEKKYQLADKKQIGKESHIAVFWNPGNFGYAKELLTESGFQQDFSYQEFVSFGKCRTSEIYNIMIKSVHNGEFYQKWEKDCY